MSRKEPKSGGMQKTATEKPDNPQAALYSRAMGLALVLLLFALILYIATGARLGLW